MSRLGARAVRKAFGRNEVLRGVDVDLHAGEVCFLLGVNGAGKSTLLGGLGGEVALDAGVVKLESDARLVFVPQKPPLAPLLTPSEHLEAMVALRGLGAEARTRYASAAEALGITRFFDAPARTLSGGTQQKVALSLGLSVGADVLLLDEPWTGLDILSARALRRLLQAERDRGAAVLAASHLPETAVALADRAVVLAGGRIVARLDPARMQGFAGDPRAFEAAIVEAMVEGGVQDAADAPAPQG